MTEYHWSELWHALINLLDYLQLKADSLKYISQVGMLDQLVRDTRPVINNVHQYS